MCYSRAMGTTTRSLAAYTEIADGDTTWYADSAALITALVAVGYTADYYQGHWALAEPQPRTAKISDDSFDDKVEAYSDLCSRVEPVEGDSILAGTPIETLTYDPGTVGPTRMSCSAALYAAVYEASTCTAMPHDHALGGSAI